MSESKNIRIPRQLKNYRKEKLSMAIYSLLSHPEKIEKLQAQVNQIEYRESCQVRIQFEDEVNEWMSILSGTYNLSLKDIVTLSLLNKEGNSYFFYPNFCPALRLQI
ncbi:MAG: hypothetical protein HOM96_02425 [Rickettsiales bacterium]|jgi:hypothetical protein|nr:hypothetical protein [Rickettsiales bacterium]